MSEKSVFWTPYRRFTDTLCVFWTPFPLLFPYLCTAKQSFQRTWKLLTKMVCLESRGDGRPLLGAQNPRDRLKQLKENKQKNMTESINEFLRLPLWVSIPLVTIYLVLMVYVAYVLWRYRRKDDHG